MPAPAVLHNNKRGTAVCIPNGSASNFRWGSSNNAIATVTNNGSNTQEVQPVANGSATITCTFDGATPDIVASRDITVVDPAADSGSVQVTENP